MRNGEMGLWRGFMLGAALWSVTAVWGGAYQDATFTLAGDGRNVRASADIAVRTGEVQKGGVLSFDMRISDPGGVYEFVCYLHSGEGWYRTKFNPTPTDNGQPNRVYHVELPISNFRGKEGKPSGWDKVDTVRFAAYPQRDRPSVIQISNLAFGRQQTTVTRAKREAIVRECLAAMPGKSGERRFIWCHSAGGMGGTNDWNSTCRFVKENGFTDLIVNLAWGGCAFYPSKVLPPPARGAKGDMLEACRAACRKYGLKMHVWKVCWRQGYSSPAIIAAQRQAGRVCVTRMGKVNADWNCPSHPANQQLEIAAMVELALEKGVDGIHFDYIRYDRDICFCDGCRERFEKQIGHRVKNWPDDTKAKGPLFDAWNKFRCANITTVVKTVWEKVKRVRPDIEISAAVFTKILETPALVGQDWLLWCREGWLDFVCPMNYTEFPARFVERVRMQQDALKGVKTRFYPGLAFECSVFGCTDALSPAQEIEGVRKMGLDGFAVFHLGEYAGKILPQLRKGPLKDVQ